MDLMVGFEPPNRSQVAASPSHLGVSGIETCSNSARSFFSLHPLYNKTQLFHRESCFTDHFYVSLSNSL